MLTQSFASTTVTAKYADKNVNIRVKCQFMINPG